MSYQVRCYIKNILLSITLAAVIFLLRREWQLVGVSNACALSGICFLILALFRTARYLRFYDLVLYGFLKFVQIWRNKNFADHVTGGYEEFVRTRRYEQNYGETFIAALLMFLCSAVVLAI